MRTFNVNHGGRCCGMGHLSGFTPGQYTRESILRDIMWPAGNNQRVTEVTLIDGQLRYPGLAAALREAGFVPVSRFYNSNSTNMVTVFHHHLDGVAFDIADIPNWDQPYVPAVPDVPPAAVAPMARVVPVVPHGFNVGDRVRVINTGRFPGEPDRGMAAVTGIYHHRQYTVSAVDAATIMVEGVGRYAAWRFERVAAANPEPVAPAPVEHQPVLRADQPALGTECTMENTRVGHRVYFRGSVGRSAGIVTVTSMTPEYIRFNGAAGGFYPQYYTHAPLAPEVHVEPEPAVRTYANVYPHTGVSRNHWATVERCQEVNGNRIRSALPSSVRIICVETGETVHTYEAN